MRFLVCGIFLLTNTLVLGQRTYVNSIDRSTGQVGETLTISGDGFSSTSSNLSVYFGGVLGTITSSSDNLIEVTIPASPLHDEVVVVNNSTRSSAASSTFFHSNFGGNSMDGLSNDDVNALFDLQTIATTQNLLYDICACDLDGDGLNDLVLTAQNDGTSRARRLIYRNTSDTVNTSFTLAQQLGNQPSSHTQCKDLDLDGRPDLIFSEIENVAEGDTGIPEIEVWRNNSTVGNISLASAFAEDFLLMLRDTNGDLRFPQRLEIEDVDDDGLPDIIVSNNSEENIDIFLNTSTTSAINFETTAQQVSVPEGQSYQARGLKLADLNDDLLVDLVVVPFESDKVFVFQNESTDGTVQFRSPLEFSFPGKLLRNVDLGDYDGDGFNDIAVTNDAGTQPGSVITLRNTTSTAGDIASFENGSETLLGISPWGISSGDVDGDGDIDIVATMSDSDENSAFLLANTSSSGSISFNPKDLITNENSRNVEIVDLNGDAKADIALVTKSLSNTAGILTILTNRNCATPTITPGSDLYCNGITFNLTTNAGVGLTYDWQIGGTSVQSGTSNTFDISGQTGTLAVTVTTTTDDGECTETSASQTFTENTNTPPSVTINPSDNPICSNVALTLTASATADNYEWTGPNGFTSTEAAPVISSGSLAAGTYGLKVFNNNGCKSVETETTVTVISTPFPKVFNADLDVFCLGGSARLSTTDYDGYDFQWGVNSANISGQTNTNLTADASGDYFVTIIDPVNECQTSSAAFNIVEATPPQPEITADSALCVDLELTIGGDTISGLLDYGLSYSWNITNQGGTSLFTDDVQISAFTFTAPGTYNLNLTTAYTEIANCSANTTQEVDIQAVPDINITTNIQDNIKCFEDTVTLSVQAGLVSYDWNTADLENFLDPDTSNIITAYTPNNEEFIDVTVSMLNAVGCVIEDSIRIANYTDANIDIISPDMNTPVENDQLLIPIDYLSIQLTAIEGTDFSWSPGGIFDDSTATMVTAYPNSSQIDVVLTGLDNNGCQSEYTIQLLQQNRVARKSFSPNNDGQGFDCWEIVNAREFNGCEIFIFDQRGRVIFSDQTPFETDCIWDGTDNNGNLAAPSGVYYYVLSCNNSEENLKGTILLAR